MDASALFTILGWSAFVGVIFSAIGAAGGILTSFGLITLFGIADPNTVKPMTQLIVLATTLAFVPRYLRWSAMVLPLSLLLGAGGLVGAYVGSTVSSLYLSDMQTFRPLFGILTLGIAAQIVWKLTADLRAGAPKGEATPGPDGKGVALTGVIQMNLTFIYQSRQYRVPLWSPPVAGLIIAFTASVFGVGGGFLLVPYMATVLGMPMHIIPATAAVAIFMSLSVSISNFLVLGAPLDYDMITPLMVGAVVGARIGPHINKVLKNHWLQAATAVIVFGIGLKYTFL